MRGVEGEDAGAGEGGVIYDKCPMCRHRHLPVPHTPRPPPPHPKTALPHSPPLSSAAKALEDEKKKASSARGAFLEELDGILHSSSSERSLWPRTVRRLVERVEEEAMARGETRAREAEEAVEKRLWAKLKEAEEQAREAEERGAAREREVADLKGRLERLERELGEREESLLRRVEEERSEVEKR